MPVCSFLFVFFLILIFTYCWVLQSELRDLPAPSGSCSWQGKLPTVPSHSSSMEWWKSGEGNAIIHWPVISQLPRAFLPAAFKQWDHCFLVRGKVTCLSHGLGAYSKDLCLVEKRNWSEMEAMPTQQGCGSGGDLGHDWDLLEQEVGDKTRCCLSPPLQQGRRGVTAISGAGPVPSCHQELLNWAVLTQAVFILPWFHY